MNYSLSKAQMSELIQQKLSHLFGVSAKEASYDQFYKALATIIKDMMNTGRSEFDKRL